MPAARSGRHLAEIVIETQARLLLADGEKPEHPLSDQRVRAEPGAAAPGLKASHRPDRARLCHPAPAQDALEDGLGRVRPDAAANRAVDDAGPDQQVGLHLAAVTADDRDAGAVLTDAGHLTAGTDLLLRHVPGQHALQVGAMVGEQDLVGLRLNRIR
ncbi:hypothetical protein GCM10010402_20530 [Actinomadura luteofluorescens]|uniref:hypothetical protein n=1 Tax=Actinomadura luteofluorescens TaxID=46163 RepID=UPI0021649681|nr:hypothetical protein [Actinomadura glauciflava]MCR3745044.1 hypothetical protein [Actinomadura glauciflava]